MKRYFASMLILVLVGIALNVRLLAQHSATATLNVANASPGALLTGCDFIGGGTGGCSLPGGGWSLVVQQNFEPPINYTNQSSCIPLSGGGCGFNTGFLTNQNHTPGGRTSLQGLYAANSDSTDWDTYNIAANEYDLHYWDYCESRCFAGAARSYRPKRVAARPIKEEVKMKMKVQYTKLPERRNRQPI